MAPKNEHTCIKENILWKITQKQVDRDRRELERDRQIEKLLESQDKLNKVIRDFIDKLDDKYVRKETFEDHKVDSNDMKKNIIKLLKFREWLMIKIWVLSWVTSAFSIIWYEYLSKIIK